MTDGIPSKPVLQLIDTLGPGGAETVFAELVRGLSHEWQPIPVLAGPGWLEKTLSGSGVESLIIPALGRRRLGYLGALIRTIRQRKVRLVHAHLLGAATYGALAAWVCGVPFIATFHGAADLPPSDRFRKYRFALINRAASSVVFVSESLRRHFLSNTTLSADCTTVIYNGVDIHGVAESQSSGVLRAEAGIQDDALLIGAIGNVRAPKGYDCLLHAVARLPASTPRWHLVIVGDTAGSTFPRIEALRDELGLQERVTFTGFRTDVAQVLRALDVFVLSSTTEGFSLSTVQALAAGVPVVATRSGGPEEIVTHEKNGVLVPPNDPNALSFALERLLNDPRSRERFAAAGPEAVRGRFALDLMIQQYNLLYRGILDVASRPAGGRTQVVIPSEK